MNNNIKNNIRKGKTADRLFGWLTISLSMAVSVIFLAAAIVVSIGKVLALFAEIGGLKYDAPGNGGRLFLFGCIFGAFWVFIGVKALLRAENAVKYNNIFADYPRMKLSDVINNTKKDLKSVSTDLNAMKKRGYWRDMTFDLDNKEVVFTRFPESSEPLPQIGGEVNTVYERRKKIPLYAIAAAAVTAICLSSLFIVPALIAGAGAFFLTRWAFPAPVYFVETQRKSPKLKKPKSTGNETLDETLNSIFENKKELTRLSKAIVSPKIRVPLGEIIAVLDQISEYVTENPDTVKKLRQFTGYYLPTTVNFLQTYEELEQKTEKGANIKSALDKIEEVTGNMTTVFKQEYDELYSDKAMDISAEAAVMQSIINENKNTF